MRVQIACRTGLGEKYSMRNLKSATRSLYVEFLASFFLLAAIDTTHAQTLSGKDLVAVLRMGGNVILMRHASSPRTPPDPAQSEAANLHHERQLDDLGRSTAQAMGDALRKLHIPVGQVLASPTYRALETIRLARLGKPKTYTQLGDGGQNMQVDPTGTRTAWLRAKVAESPTAGTNTIIVTHLPNVNEAFPSDSVGLTDGEALIFHPDGHGGAVVLGHLKIEEWPQLASQ
jgi:phosphohistidine phosphatase SixA